jgi:predicted metal-dependent peptidase
MSPAGATKLRAPRRPRPPNPQEAERKRMLKRQLQTDLAGLLVWHPFTASLALHLELVPVRDARVGTAATDGRRVYFDIDFAATLDDAGRAFVLAHEVWHCVLDHAHRQGERTPQLWGLAVDSEVNSILVREGLAPPSGAVHFRKMDGASAEQIYAWLLDRSDRAAQIKSFDVHALVANGKPPRAGDWVEDPDFRADEAAGTSDPQLRREWQVRLVDAERVARQRGLLPAGLSCVVQQALAPPSVPWQAVLRDFVQRSGRGGDWSYARVAKRHLWRGAWLPGRHGAALNLLVAIDTSGSTRHALGRFVSEIAALGREYARVEMTVVECDAKVHRTTHLTEGDLDAWERASRHHGLRGGGGTDFNPVFDLLAQHTPQALVFFTDGCGDAPDHPPSVPVLWVLADEDGSPPVEWGARVWMTPGHEAAPRG